MMRTVIGHYVTPWKIGRWLHTFTCGEIVYSVIKDDELYDDVLLVQALTMFINQLLREA